MNKKIILQKFFIEKNYPELIELLTDSTDIYELEFLAKCYLELQNYKTAGEIFAKCNMHYEHGRCHLLMGNITETQNIWKKITSDNPATLWGKSLLEFINLYVINIPTFFQIRAFLEVDLDALLKARLINYCENIANGAHILAKNNQESYKFIGRVFINNKYFDLAELYLNEAKNVCYIDPEVHYLLAKCHMNGGNLKEAKNALNASIKTGYGYFPAKKLLEKINLG